MSEQGQEWFIAERARAMARMYLTRRADLAITEEGRAVGLEFLVFVTRNGGERSVRQFGVFLSGSKPPVTEERLNKELRPRLKSLQRVGPFPYPVCLFHFTTDDDQGYYTWLAEPVVAKEGPRLLMHAEAHCRKLDRVSLDEIVERVSSWYDAFFSKITVKCG
jgi:hypothetical protein